MRPVFLCGALLIGVAGLWGCATTGDVHEDGAVHAPMTKHFEDSLFAVTEGGEFSVEVLFPDKNLEMGVNRVDLIVHNRRDEDVTGADISAEPWMPSMGHGVMESPTVMEKGGGLYNLHNVVLSMTGDWELRLRISKGKVTDTVTVALPPIGAMGHMHAMKAPDPSTIDTSTQKESMNGSFLVTYTSDPMPVPVNRFVQWTLGIRGKDGGPVSGAKVMILGDMPEHGHGFPTEPEVVEGEEAGLYRVEGLKFSMPGWWVVTFHITAGDTSDQVSFNLLPE